MESTTPIIIHHENEQQEDKISTIENISQVFCLHFYYNKFDKISFFFSSQYQIYHLMNLFI